MQKAAPQNNYHYNKSLQPYANQLRKRMTKGEACLWKYCLSRSQMLGFTFRRQRPVLNYIADFMSFDLMLIIEVDGYTHHDEAGAARDKKRDQELEAVGFTIFELGSATAPRQCFDGDWGLDKGAGWCDSACFSN